MELEELGVLAEESKKKKNKMDASARAKGAQLLTRIWSDEGIDPNGALESMNELQSEALADGVGKAWPQMAEGRRQQFLSWLPAPTTERASRRIALTAAAIIVADGKTAAELLCKLLPTGQKSMSKELRHTLRSSLFGDKRIEFGILNQSGIPPENLFRLYSALTDLAFGESSDISPVIRSQLALAVQGSLRTLRENNREKADQLGALIEAQVRAWPPALRDQYLRQLETTKSVSGIESPALSGARALERDVTSQPRTPISSVVERLDILNELSNIEKHLNERLAAISNEMDVLGQLGKLLTSLKSQHLALQAELESAREKIASSAESTLRMSEANCLLQEQLEQQRSKSSELSRTIDQIKHEGEEEKRRLSHQISANAAGRIDEFRNRLGSILSRLVVDLPQKHSPVSAELGKVLLLQFHQFLDALRQEGIETGPRKAAPL